MTQMRRVWSAGILSVAATFSLLLVSGCRNGALCPVYSISASESITETQTTASFTADTVGTATTAPPTLPPAQILPNEEPVVAGLTPLPKEEYYGRQQLATMERAKNLLAAYDRIAAGIDRQDEDIQLMDSNLPLTVDELKTVAEYYWRDYPQHFWYRGTYLYRYQGSTVVSMQPSYSMTGSQLTQAQKDWQTAVKDALAGLNASDSEYDRGMQLHDRLAVRCFYEEGTNAHNAYGALAEGRAVCEGYARAYQYLLYQAGLQSLYVTGTGTSPGTILPIGHGWNIVRIDGAYYHVDVTWDDQGEEIYYAYLNLKDQQIREDHQMDQDNYPLPACNSQDANYFRQNDLIITGPTVDRVAYLLEQGNLSAYMYITGDVKNFWNWFECNHTAVARKLGITGRYTYGYSSLGHEVHLYIKT